MTNAWSLPYRLSDKALGRTDGCYWGVAQHQPAKQRRGEGAACAMGGAALDTFACKVLQLAAGQAQQIGGRLGIAAGDDDVQMRMTPRQVCRSLFRLGERIHRSSRQDAKLRPIRSNPVDLWQKTLMQRLQTVRGVQFPA